MKKIGNVVTPMFNKRINPNAMETQLKLFYKHPLVQTFMQNHPEVTPDVYRRSFSQLRQFVTERESCEGCRELDQCPNMVKGHYPTLYAYGGYLDLQMNECSKLRAYKEEQQRKKLIRCHQIPREIQTATFETIDYDENRDEALNHALDFCLKIANNEPVKGLYLYGPFGVGKSYIAGAVVNKLASHGIGSLMIHMSALAVEMRDSISGKMVSSKIETLSNVPILVLDDIGSENISPWLRDDVLSIVFHNRMSNQLPTIFTSNLTLDELQEYFSYTQKSGQEPIKAARIMERIRPFVYPICVEGKNRRYEK
ncbi:primosomal protein DnaI [Paenactinomyces guangxiensis]|uniref:Primosomal protein DnaI n=1 Tax=Paenactinomyces guangxiensis TaxID=1490290 RepID=A0A7W2A9U0_9BACL|nr:primosomal protein DnaI [Paenactinomyces guangxiensis]MBA4495243.1 primosomal protein DnaI [Paenactinomyces guangxiensis]MBH8592327.1 primosomal protein DnaI [Paenactinomyces guangxiensis]